MSAVSTTATTFQVLLKLMIQSKYYIKFKGKVKVVADTVSMLSHLVYDMLAGNRKW